MRRTFLALVAAAMVLSAALISPPVLDAQRGGGGGNAAPPEPGPFDRLSDGRPDMNGVWSVSAGGLADITTGISAVDGQPVEGDDRVIPYTPVYAQLRAEFQQRQYEEPELHCYMSGVPSHMWRQGYMGAGLIIQHSDGHVAFHHEFQGSRRIVPIDGEFPPENIKMFMGAGVGRWEGDTLVIETRNNNAITWLDNDGDRHSDQLVVVERFTPINQDAWDYSATFTDPAAYTAPWTISGLMRRGGNQEAEILEFACVEGNTDNLHYTEDVGGTTELAAPAAPDAFVAPAGGRGGGGRGGRGGQ